ncbi:MAG: CPBP family intramembrane metalloprotease, partial [Leptospiraceae bacterium]|nr:CPBP family intramembrane metalloprotease [Leptospiraceae bacterium]
ALDAMRSPEHRQIYFTYKERGPDVVDAVWLEVSADRIVSMHRRLEWNGNVPDNPPQSDWKQLLLLLRVPIQIGLIVLALLHCIFVFKKFRPRWLWPALLTLGMAAGTLVLWYFANGVWWPALRSYNIPLYALYASNLLLVLLISLRVSSDRKNFQWWRRFRSRWSGILLMGLCLALVFQPVNILFAELARYYGAWWSGLAFRESNLHNAIWPVLCFALILGSIPAISEELIYRELLGGTLRKWMRTWAGSFGRFMEIVLGVLCTSFVWGIAHLGYEVYPWYLRLLEFLLLTGPMQYIVWRRFGLAVSIAFHFWINFFYVISFLLGM